jgi:L-threonylcarbamoyladenylate synthase
MNFISDIENCLGALQKGVLTGIPTQAGWMLAADATNSEALDKLWGFANNASDPELVILLATEQDLLLYVSALDLAVFERFESFTIPTAIWFTGILGLPDPALGNDGSAAIAIVGDEFCFHLIKRLQKPIAVLPMSRQDLSEAAFFIAEQHTIPHTAKFAIENFV